MNTCKSNQLIDTIREKDGTKWIGERLRRSTTTRGRRRTSTEADTYAAEIEDACAAEMWLSKEKEEEEETELVGGVVAGNWI